ncbi:MAG: cbb3-type cytochrome c oxidase subunit 3 [Bacteroidia bacterium]
MYKEVLSAMDDVSLFPLVAILLFFVFFVAIFIYVMRMDKREVDDLAAMPLKSGTLSDLTNEVSLNGKAK